MPVRRPFPGSALLLAATAPLLAAGAMSPAAPSAGREHDPADAAEYRVKAAFLLNFLRYTRWPEEAFEGSDAPLVLLVVGEDPFGDVLEETFEEKRVHGRAVAVLRASRPPRKVAAHAVFAAGLGARSRKEILDRCAGRPVLLVGEVEGFAVDGACINFYIEKSKVNFEINVDAVEAAELTVSSQLLKLARIVRTRRGG